ncbi:MAG: hypothetical protein GX827_04120 [Clostridiales bacterium]|nr:hypothetical protein [Clostridiales bacterium]
MIILGADVGSTGCKCAAYSENGRYICGSYREYPHPAGVLRIDAEILKSAVFATISETAAAARSFETQFGKISSLAVSSFGESFVALDGNMNPLAPVVMYTDGYGADEARRLASDPGTERIISRECLIPDATYSLPMMMRIIRRESKIADKVNKFLLITDYITFCLTGETVIPGSLAARTMALDIRSGKWDAELLEAAGINPSLLSIPVPDGSPVGRILKSQAEKLGLPQDTLIIAGSHDQIANALGCGVCAAGEAVNTTGSVECITPVFDKIPADPEYYHSGYVCVPFSDSGLLANYAYNYTGGTLLRWLRDNLTEFKGDGGAYQLLDEKAALKDITDVLVIPHFSGAGYTPDRIPSAKGAITGLTFLTDICDIYRAALEGSAFEMRYNLERLNSLGAPVHSLTAAGGGAKSPLWLQIKSDIFGLPITVSGAKEAGTLGAAMLAATKSLCIYNSFGEAAENCVRNGKTYYPTPDAQKRYGEKYARYIEARNRLINLYD